MERFVVYSEKLGYFKNCYDNSLHYHEGDFVENVENAKWFKTEDKAFKMAVDLARRKFETNCVRIYVGVDILDTIPTKELIAAKLKECNVIVEATDALSDKEVEKISEAEWQKYQTAKRYVEAYG